MICHKWTLKLKSPEKGRETDFLLNVHSQLWDRADLDTSFLNWFEKSSRQPEIKVHLQVEFRFNLRSVLLHFQPFTEKPVFECAFAHSIMLSLSYFVKNSTDSVSVICKLAMKWYIMRMCASWLSLFKARAKRTGKKSQVDANWTWVETCVGWPNELASFLTSTRKSQKNPFQGRHILYFIG